MDRGQPPNPAAPVPWDVLASLDGFVPPVPDESWTPAAPPGLEFPGCIPRYLPASALDIYERRIEFWDADTETAWVCESTPPCHERPSQALSALGERIAQVRGSPVT